MIEYKLGYFAASLCGHDKGRVYMIVSEEGEMLGLSDGRRRTLAHPKKKKKKHVQLIRSKKGAEVFSALRGSGDADGEIRRAVAAAAARKAGTVPEAKNREE